MNNNAGDNSTTQRLARARAEEFNDAAAEAFAERMLDTLNAAVLALLVSLGHRTNLFDVMARIHPATAEDIARATRLDLRYLREWLGAMASWGVVEHSPAMGTYYLSSEHAASLTRSAAPVNIASTMQFIALLGAVEDAVVVCFQKGGEIPFASHSRFREVVAGESDTSVAPVFLDSILPLFPGLAEAICTPEATEEGAQG
jgi:hypothetical protein